MGKIYPIYNGGHGLVAPKMAVSMGKNASSFYDDKNGERGAPFWTNCIRTCTSPHFGTWCICMYGHYIHPRKIESVWRRDTGQQENFDLRRAVLPGWPDRCLGKFVRSIVNDYQLNRHEWYFYWTDCFSQSWCTTRNSLISTPFTHLVSSNSVGLVSAAAGKKKLRPEQWQHMQETQHSCRYTPQRWRHSMIIGAASLEVMVVPLSQWSIWKRNLSTNNNNPLWGDVASWGEIMVKFSRGCDGYGIKKAHKSALRCTLDVVSPQLRAMTTDEWL